MRKRKRVKISGFNLIQQWKRLRYKVILYCEKRYGGSG